MRRQHDGRAGSTGRRGRLTAGAVLAVAMLAASCGGGGDETSGGGAGGGDGELPDNVIRGGVEASGEPVTGGSLTVGLESETNSYMPSQFQGSQAGYNVAYSVFDPLAARDVDGEIQPYLAESIEPDEDFTAWTVTLPPDVTFHDGTPLNAEAMKTMFDDHLTVEGANTRGALRDVERLEVVDELTFRYVMARPHAAFDDVLAGPAGWPFSPTAAADMGDAFGDQPVGTGPFRFVSWQRDGAFVLERNDDYWQEGLPHLDEITFRPIPDEATRATSLETGDVDAVQSVRLSSFLSRVLDLPDVEIALGLSNGAGNTIFNTAAPPFDDVRVRRAAAHALDQQGLVDVVAGASAPYTELRSQYVASDSPYYSEAAAEAWPEHDPERARELLDEYVQDPERSDGLSPGEPVSFEYDATNVPSLTQQAEAYEGLWEEVGFDVSVVPVEQSVHIQEALTGDFQAKSFRAGTDSDPLVMLENAHGDPAEFITNFSNYTHETVEDMLQTLRTTADEQERAAAVEELSVLLAEEVPVYWTGSDLTFIAHRTDVHGVASWTFPDGTLGDGATPAITYWGQVWTDG